MNAGELLDLLRANAIGIVSDDGTLRLKAPRGFLTTELRDALAEHKPELIRLLTEPGARTAPGSIPRRPAGAGPLPLSRSQRQLWFLDQLAPGNPFYNNPAAFALHGALDVGALERALTAVVGRHEVLRTVFGSAAGEP